MNDDTLDGMSTSLSKAAQFVAQIEVEVKRGTEASAVIILEALIEQAFIMRASDIHIDPTAEVVSVRFLVDGVL